MEDRRRFLSPNEVKFFVESLQTFDISEMGSIEWCQQQERIFRLFLQECTDVRLRIEEKVKEEIVIQQKVPILVHELITLELWRLKILPHLLEPDIVSKVAVPLYIIFWYEISVVSLLEIMLFEKDVMDSASDVLVDLMDYCYRNIMIFKSIKAEEIKNNFEAVDDIEHILEKKRKMEFDTGFKCISIFQSMAQHNKIIPLSALHRLLDVHDIPLLFTELVCNPLWVRKTNNETEKYVDGKWNKVSRAELMKLNKVEGQLWITLIHLLCGPPGQKKYDMNGFRKDKILKLRSKVNNFLMEQIPELRAFLCYLHRLSKFNAPVPKTKIMIEQIPEIWKNIQDSNQDKWEEIAKNQSEKCFKLSGKELYEFCSRVSEFFELKKGETPLCAHCQLFKGDKMCSRCKNEWYCGRSCQVSHWKKHKPACDLMARGGEKKKKKTPEE